MNGQPILPGGRLSLGLACSLLMRKKMKMRRERIEERK